MKARDIIVEFAPVGGDDREPNEEAILRQLAAMWWLGTEKQMGQAQRTLDIMGWEIGQDDSGDEDAGVFLVRPGDEHGDTYMAFPHSELESLSEGMFDSPRTAASQPEIVSVQDDGDVITIKVRGNDGQVRALSNSNPAVLQKQLNLKYGLRLPHSIARKFVGMPTAMAEDEMSVVNRDIETEKMAAQDEKAGGLAEAQLDEKSVSKAQFRTMAAAAHNPKFAKKVGIDQDVAKEFHSADRGSSYKKLPKKVNESKRTKTMITESRTYKLWESAGQKLSEAQLTADQINQIFTQVEQGANAAGDNRTMLGKGKDVAGKAVDAASAVNKAWEDLKTKVQNSGPIAGLDAKYDQAAEQLKQATGGDQGVMKYVQKYRDFAKKHPIAQSLIYSALIAAAGISGAGLGGAAALGLFKMVDKLLQGEKFSSATYAGAKTGAMAYGASKLADYMKGGDKATQNAAGGGQESPDIQQGLASDQAFQDRLLNKYPPDQGYTVAAGDGGKSIQVLDATGRKVYQGDIPLKTMDMKTFADLTNAGKMATPGISSGSAASDAMAGVTDAASKTATSTVSNAAGTMSGITADQMVNHPAYQAMIQKFGDSPGSRQAAMAAAKSAILRGVKESVDLTESQLYLVIGKILERQRKLDEGIWDSVKGAAGKAVGSAVDWAKTKGANLTTKVTADKLLQAWKKAGSPMDSLDVAKIVQDAGVPAATIKQVYGTMKIPYAGEPGGGAMPAPAPGATPTPAGTPAPAAPAANPAIGGIPAVPGKPAPAPAAAPVAKAATPQTPAATPQTPAAKPVTGFNYDSVMKMPGMQNYAKPAAAPAKPADFSKGPTGYGATTTTFKPAPAKKPVAAEDSSWGMAPEGKRFKK